MGRSAAPRSLLPALSPSHSSAVSSDGKSCWLVPSLARCSPVLDMAFPLHFWLYRRRNNLQILPFPGESAAAASAAGITDAFEDRQRRKGTVEDPGGAGRWERARGRDGYGGCRAASTLRSCSGGDQIQRLGDPELGERAWESARGQPARSSGGSYRGVPSAGTGGRPAELGPAAAGPQPAGHGGAGRRRGAGAGGLRRRPLRAGGAAAGQHHLRPHRRLGAQPSHGALVGAEQQREYRRRGGSAGWAGGVFAFVPIFFFSVFLPSFFCFFLSFFLSSFLWGWGGRGMRVFFLLRVGISFPGAADWFRLAVCSGAEVPLKDHSSGAKKKTFRRPPAEHGPFQPLLHHPAGREGEPPPLPAAGRGRDSPRGPVPHTACPRVTPPAAGDAELWARPGKAPGLLLLLLHPWDPRQPRVSPRGTLSLKCLCAGAKGAFLPLVMKVLKWDSSDLFPITWTLLVNSNRMALTGAKQNEISQRDRWQVSRLEQ